MRILIVDDTEIHHMSADQTLKGHEVMHARTHFLGEVALILQTDPKIIMETLTEAGYSEEHIYKYEIAESIQGKLENAGMYKPDPFDVVLLDLLMPTSTR